jgi:hypothetical protein
METAASVGTTSRFVAHWVESTQNGSCRTVCGRYASAAVLVSKPRVYIDDSRYSYRNCVKRPNRSGRRGISDAKRRNMLIKSAKVTSTL